MAEPRPFPYIPLPPLGGTTFIFWPIFIFYLPLQREGFCCFDRLNLSKCRKLTRDHSVVHDSCSGAVCVTAGCELTYIKGWRQQGNCEFTETEKLVQSCCFLMISSTAVTLASSTFLQHSTRALISGLWHLLFPLPLTRFLDISKAHLIASKSLPEWFFQEHPGLPTTPLCPSALSPLPCPVFPMVLITSGTLYNWLCITLLIYLCAYYYVVVICWINIILNWISSYCCVYCLASMKAGLFCLFIVVSTESKTVTTT